MADYIDQMREIEAEETRLSGFWNPRNIQRDIDTDIYNLIMLPKRSGFEQVVLNEPKVLWDTIVALLSRDYPRFTIPMPLNFTGDQKDKMNKVERLALGILRELDGRQFQRGFSPWLRELADWCCSGWYACFPHIEVVDGELQFWADLYDPNIVYPEWGRDGLVKVIKSYETLGIYARTEAEAHDWNLQADVKDDELVKIINYWKKDRKKGIQNAVMMAGELVKPLKTEEGFTAIPFITGPVSGRPTRTHKPGWQAKVGESVVASNRDLYDAVNRWVTMMMQIAADVAYPPIIDYTKTGHPKLKKSDMGTGTLIPRQIEEKLEVLKFAATPVEVNTLLSLLGQSIQRGGLPNVVYGSIPFEVSGYAISQLQSAVYFKAGPYKAAMENIISLVMIELLRQYKAQGYDRITLTTTDPTQLGKGMYFVEEFGSDDIPDVVSLQATLQISAPQDKVQQILAAKQAISPPQVLSRETIWGPDFLNVQDSRIEYERLIDDQINELPIIKIIAAIEGLKPRIRDAELKGDVALATTLRRYQMMLEMQAGTRQGIPETPGQATEGIRPETSPPEMGMSGVNPDVVRQMWQKGPPGLKRRPQSSEERAESKRLYNARGEVI